MEGIRMAAFLFVYIVCFDTQCHTRCALVYSCTDLHKHMLQLYHQSLCLSQLTYTTRSVQLFKLFYYDV